MISEVLEKCPECGQARKIILRSESGKRNFFTGKPLNCVCECWRALRHQYPNCIKCNDTGWILKEREDGGIYAYPCKCKDAQRRGIKKFKTADNPRR